MKQIAKNILLEDGYSGVVLGALILKRGTILIDAPLRPDDCRSWIAVLRNRAIGAERLLVNLDAHTDRALGNRIMDMPILSHRGVHEVYDKRSSVFKSQNAGSGEDWEDVSGLSGIRWLVPNMMFTERIEIHWDDFPVTIEHHPGPQTGSSWVVLPEQEVVFVGDVIMPNQPPFLDQADIDLWLESIDLLVSKRFNNFTVINSRTGETTYDELRDFRRFLRDIQVKLERLAKKKAAPETTESLIPGILSKLKFTNNFQQQYSDRLRSGLRLYYQRHYLTENKD